MTENILVTGYGILSAIGKGKKATLNALENKISGIGPLKYLENSTLTDFPVGEVQMSDSEMKKLLNIPENEIIVRTALMGIIALDEALKEAKILENRPKRIAFISGTTVGGMEKSEKYYLDFLNPESAEHSDFISVHDCGSCTEMIASYFNGFDIVTTISTACSSAANAIILGAELIKTNRADIAIVGGSECITKYHLNGFNTLMILDHNICRPFDKSRSGLNLGEGAAYLVLESEKSTKNRNIKPLCKLSAYANTCDAFHQTASSPDGEGAYLSMKKAIEMSELTCSDIDYINAHGTGTENNDSSEGTAVTRVFGENVPPISSTKSYTGHTTSAAGSVEAAISILAIVNNFIPANLNITDPINELPKNTLINSIVRKEINHVLTNSFGFGGNDSSLIFSKIK